jgi:hypothetical protein
MMDSLRAGTTREPLGNHPDESGSQPVPSQFRPFYEGLTLPWKPPASRGAFRPRGLSVLTGYGQ